MNSDTRIGVIAALLVVAIVLTLFYTERAAASSDTEQLPCLEAAKELLELPPTSAEISKARSMKAMAWIELHNAYVEQDKSCKVTLDSGYIDGEKVPSVGVIGLAAVFVAAAFVSRRWL